MGYPWWRTFYTIEIPHPEVQRIRQVMFVVHPERFPNRDCDRIAMYRLLDWAEAKSYLPNKIDRELAVDAMKFLLERDGVKFTQETRPDFDREVD